MKKILLFSLMVLALAGHSIGIVSAEGSSVPDTTVTVTEKIPGADCTPFGGGTSVDSRKFKCTVKSDFSGVIDSMRVLLRYVTLIAILSGLLMLVISGVQMSLTGKKDKAIAKFKQVLGAIFVLMMIGLILNSVAPWVYK